MKDLILSVETADIETIGKEWLFLSEYLITIDNGTTNSTVYLLQKVRRVNGTEGTFKWRKEKEVLHVDPRHVVCVLGNINDKND